MPSHGWTAHVGQMVSLPDGGSLGNMIQEQLVERTRDLRWSLENEKQDCLTVYIITRRVENLNTRPEILRERHGMGRQSKIESLSGLLFQVFRGYGCVGAVRPLWVYGFHEEITEEFVCCRFSHLL